MAFNFLPEQLAKDAQALERLWRSVKYEAVYLKDYAMAPEAGQGRGW